MLSVVSRLFPSCQRKLASSFLNASKESWTPAFAGVTDFGSDAFP